MGAVVALDVGTNTVSATTAAWTEREGPGAPVRWLGEGERFTRLGEGVDRTGAFTRQAVARTLAACDALAHDGRVAAGTRRGVKVVAALTSASRDAGPDGAALAAALRERGILAAVIPGAVEAALAHAGATLDHPRRGTGATVAVLDVGGGSTELALGAPSAGDLTARVSVDVGSVRLTERRIRAALAAGTPRTDALEAARRDVDMALAHAFERLGRALHAADPVLVGSDSPATTAAALLGAEPGAVLATEALRRLLEAVAPLTPEALRARAPEALTGRADLFPAGLLVLIRALELGGFRGVRPTPLGLRHGLALAALAGPWPPPAAAGRTLCDTPRRAAVGSARLVEGDVTPANDVRRAVDHRRP